MLIVKSFSKFVKITRIRAFLFLSEISKKLFHGNFLKFYSNQDIENLKDQELELLVLTMLSIRRKFTYGLLDLNHVVFLGKELEQWTICVSEIMET